MVGGKEGGGRETGRGAKRGGEAALFQCKCHKRASICQP